MLFLYILAIFCFINNSVIGFSSVLDEDYQVMNSDELGWPKTYTVKATKISLTSDIIEDFTAWKTPESSRVDYNQGAVKVLTYIPKKSTYFAHKFEVHPETTEEELNKIVCHSLNKHKLVDEDENDIRRKFYSFIRLDDILPYIPTFYGGYDVVGNETILDIETIRFEPTGQKHRSGSGNTIWAYYVDDMGWVPVRYEKKGYNDVSGSLRVHEIWTFSDFAVDFDEDVFDVSQFGCEEDAVQHTADSEKITKELMFVDPHNENHVDYVFTHFQNNFYRQYAHEDEFVMRKTIFAENMRMISAVNRRNLTYKLGINQFSDWTPEEIQGSLGEMPRPKEMVGTVAFPYEESQLEDIVNELPKQYDMRVLGIISPVKDQGQCGSCWTFAATAVTESGLAKVNGGRVLALSTQAIVDCAFEYLSKTHEGGCHGGYDYAAYEFIMKHGLPTEEEYGPYKSKGGFCKIGNMTKTYSISGYTDVTHNSINAMKVAAVNHGPIYIRLFASGKFFMYSSGIFYQNNEECNPNWPTHAVTLVGYGESYGELFWILKNSWGESWGMSGYMLIAAKDNVCGVTSDPSYPVFH